MSHTRRGLGRISAMKRRSCLAELRAAAPAILPSLLLCDFGNLEREVARLTAAGVKALHLDVMDGHFVPNFTYGFPIVEALRKLTDLPLDVHLMISDPLRYVPQFVEAGADLLTVHVEAVEDPRRALEEMHRTGVAAGLAINPDTPLSTLDGCLDQCDLVLVMSVQAGFGGQSFRPAAVDRLRQLRGTRSDLLLEVDGGINRETIQACARAGADLFVVGSGIFRAEDYAQAIGELRSQATAAG
jgi:ribulose-phosphate 3-epimerase